MSIQTDDFSEQRIISAVPASPNEEAIERALRPKGLRDYVGQTKAREQLDPGGRSGERGGQRVLRPAGAGVTVPALSPLASLSAYGQPA